VENQRPSSKRWPPSAGRGGNDCVPSRVRKRPEGHEPGREAREARADSGRPHPPSIERAVRTRRSRHGLIRVFEALRAPERGARAAARRPERRTETRCSEPCGRAATGQAARPDREMPAARTRQLARPAVLRPARDRRARVPVGSRRLSRSSGQEPATHEVSQRDEVLGVATRGPFEPASNDVRISPSRDPEHDDPETEEQSALGQVGRPNQPTTRDASHTALPSSAKAQCTLSVEVRVWSVRGRPS
jgi:hypothetical protein